MPGERGISLRHSKLLYQQTKVLLSVGSREFLAILLSSQIECFFLLQKRKNVKSLDESITKSHADFLMFQFLRNMQGKARGKLEQASLVTLPTPEFSIASEFVEDPSDVKAEEELSKDLAHVQELPT